MRLLLSLVVLLAPLGCRTTNDTGSTVLQNENGPGPGPSRSARELLKEMGRRVDQASQQPHP